MLFYWNKICFDKFAFFRSIVCITTKTEIYGQSSIFIHFHMFVRVYFIAFHIQNPFCERYLLRLENKEIVILTAHIQCLIEVGHDRNIFLQKTLLSFRCTAYLSILHSSFCLLDIFSSFGSYLYIASINRILLFDCRS